MKFGDIKISISVEADNFTDEQLNIIAQNYEDSIDSIDFEAIIRNKLIEHGVGWVAWDIQVAS